jgi:uncharacterized protein involved in outer membrane biogenesis
LNRAATDTERCGTVTPAIAVAAAANGTVIDPAALLAHAAQVSEIRLRGADHILQVRLAAQTSDQLIDDPSARPSPF